MSETFSQNVINNRGSLNALQAPRGYSSGKRGVPAWLLARLKAQADARFRINPFKSIREMCDELKLPQSRFEAGWRLVTSELGHINALPNSHGMIIATDGVMCVIYRASEDVFLGHADSWIALDEQPDEIVKPIDPAKLAKREKEKQDLIDFLLTEI